jgi:mannose-6-phosphate isomerase-like protein (cupin superfamily)
MRSAMGIRVLALAGLGVFLAGSRVGGGNDGIGRPASSKAVVWPASEIAWAPNPALEGARQAVLWGDPARGPYGALKSIPAGKGLPLHTHTADHRVLIVAGTLHVEVQGISSDLGTGSYILFPAGVPHRAGCTPGVECVYLEDAQGAAGMTVVTQGAKQRPIHSP